MNLDYLLEGFAALTSPSAILAITIGAIVGSLTGVLPGLGPVGAMAILFPFGLNLDPAAGILMLLSVYMGSRYGGSTTAILMRVPGDENSIVIADDGYAMTKKGRGGAALAICAVGSFFAGTLGIGILMIVGSSLSDLALHVAEPEILVLTVVALLIITRSFGRSFAASLAAAGVGLVLSTVGFDPFTGDERFTFGQDQLFEGLDITPLAVGLFGITNIFVALDSKAEKTVVQHIRFRELAPSRQEWRDAAPAIVRGSFLGFLYGLLPGPRALGSFASYRLEHTLAKRKGITFGKGAVQAVAGPESADNAVASTTLIPLLLLGLPFTAGAVLLLGALTLHGIVPGPLFLQNDPALFWQIIAGLYLANLALLIFNLPLVGLFVQVLRVPRDILYSAIIFVSVIGTYAVNNSLFEVGVLIVVSIVGYLMVKARLSRIALMLGFVLGSFIETALAQTISLSSGEPFYLLQRPVAVALMILGLVVLASTPVRSLIVRVRPGRGGTPVRVAEEGE